MTSDIKYSSHFVSNLSFQDIDRVIQLLVSHRGFSYSEAQERLSYIEVIVLAKVGNSIIGMASLRKPNDIPNDDAFLRAKSDYNYFDFQLELSYVVVEPNFRNSGIATGLVKLLCEKYIGANIFAVTESMNSFSVKLKLKNGFKKEGLNFKDRKSRNELSLYIKLKV